MGGLAMPPLPVGASRVLQSEGHNHKWPTEGRLGYVTLGLGCHQCFRAGDTVSSVPQVGGLANVAHAA